MNLIKLQKVKNVLNDLAYKDKMLRVPLSDDACLKIFRHSPAIYLVYPELERPLFLVSLEYESKTLNKNKDKNLKFFKSIVGQDVYDYLEGLISLDKERYFNKGSGIGYMRLSVKDLESLLILLDQWKGGSL